MDRINNKMDDLLVNVALKPDDISFIGISTMEVQSRSSIPDNIENWKFFEDDSDILNFMLLEGRYDS